MKLRDITFNGLDLDKYYPEYDPKHSRGFNHRSDTLHNANADSTVTFKPYSFKPHNSKSISWKIILL